MKVLKRYQQAFRELPEEIRAAEAQAESEKEAGVLLQNGERQGSAASDVTELFVRAGGEKTGFTYTQDLEEEPLEVIRRAYESSFYSEASGPEPMNGGSEAAVPGYVVGSETAEVPGYAVGSEAAAAPGYAAGSEAAEAQECVAGGEAAAAPERVAGDEALAASECEAEAENLDMALLWQKAGEIEGWLTEKEPDLSLRLIAITDRVRAVGAVNTKGLDAFSQYRVITVLLQGLDEDGAGGMFSGERTYRTIEEIPASLFEDDLKRWKLQKLPETEFESGTWRCVVSAEMMTNILLTSWQMFTGRTYLSGGTPFAGKLGEKVGETCLNLSDRVSIPESGFTFALDCEGTPGKDVEIIKNGVLTGLLQNLRTAGQMEAAGAAGSSPASSTGKAGTTGATEAAGAASSSLESSAGKARTTGAAGAAGSSLAFSTGNAGRKALLGGNIHTEVLVTPKNFGIEPGTAGLEELLLALGDGLYLYESFDVFHSVNVASGDFSIPCNGIIVKNGKLTGTAHGLTLNSSVQDLLAKVGMTGNRLAVQPMTMLNSYAVYAPDVLTAGLCVSR